MGELAQLPSIKLISQPKIKICAFNHAFDFTSSLLAMQKIQIYFYSLVKEGQDDYHDLWWYEHLKLHKLFFFISKDALALKYMKDSSKGTISTKASSFLWSVVRIFSLSSTVARKKKDRKLSSTMKRWDVSETVLPLWPHEEFLGSSHKLRERKDLLHKWEINKETWVFLTKSTLNIIANCDLILVISKLHKFNCKTNQMFVFNNFFILLFY